MPALEYDGDGPSPDEVRRRIDRLYDRAESDTGTFNATRAAAIPRQRGTDTRGRSEGDAEPAIQAFARQWFDVARAKLGPSVPTWQSDRKVPVRPDRAPEAARPGRPAERPAELRALEAPQATQAPTGVARELTSGSAQAPVTELLPELSDQRAAPAAAGESRRVESASSADAQPDLDGDVAAWPLYQPAPESSPQSLAALLPAVPDHTAAAHQVDLPTSGADTYGADLATGATAPYATPLSADLTAYYASGPPAEVTTATQGAGLPDISALALAAHAPAVPVAPATASALAAPTAPDALAARDLPATTYTPVASGESWLMPVAGRSTQAERVIAFARAQIGLPCVWGAVGPGSYDAAGLTQAAWKTVGVTLPRTPQAQLGAGVQVSLADVQVGDLVFFHDDLGHVGIWSGDGMMIHAPGPGALIREESVFFAGQSAIKGAIRPA
ncbi:NlpC/P60 family protein [Streptomyces paradoxus]|uniref:NlpC/P60 family protein n=1 Tax=Streptomyces paradoxus TaxID=66375 RepID=UPI00362E19BB